MSVDFTSAGKRTSPICVGVVDKWAEQGRANWLRTRPHARCADAISKLWSRSPTRFECAKPHQRQDHPRTLVDKRKQLVGGVGIALFDLGEDLGDVGHDVDYSEMSIGGVDFEHFTDG